MNNNQNQIQIDHLNETIKKLTDKLCDDNNEKYKLKDQSKLIAYNVHIYKEKLKHELDKDNRLRTLLEKVLTADNQYGYHNLRCELNTCKENIAIFSYKYESNKQKLKNLLIKYQTLKKETRYCTSSIDRFTDQLNELTICNV